MSGTGSASPLRMLQRGASDATYSPENGRAPRGSQGAVGFWSARWSAGARRSGHGVVPAEPEGHLGGGGDQLADREVQRLAPQPEARSRHAHRGDDVAVGVADR